MTGKDRIEDKIEEMTEDKIEGMTEDKIEEMTEDKIEEMTEEMKEESIEEKTGEMTETGAATVERIIATDKEDRTITKTKRPTLPITKEEINAVEEHLEEWQSIIMSKAILKTAPVITKSPMIIK